MFIFRVNSNDKLRYCGSVSSAVPRGRVTAVTVSGFLQQQMPSRRGTGINGGGTNELAGAGRAARASPGRSRGCRAAAVLAPRLPPRRVGVFVGVAAEAQAQPGPETRETSAEGVCGPYPRTYNPWQRTRSPRKGQKRPRGGRRAVAAPQLPGDPSIPAGGWGGRV